MNGVNTPFPSNPATGKCYYGLVTTTTTATHLISVAELCSQRR